MSKKTVERVKEKLNHALKGEADFGGNIAEIYNIDTFDYNDGRLFY